MSQQMALGAYFGSCPVNPAFGAGVNVNEDKAFHKFWMIELKQKTKTRSMKVPLPAFF